MDREKVRELLEAVAAGAMAPEQALARLRALPVEDLRFARVDLHRSLRHGVPEAVFCQGKTPEQVVAIVRRLAEEHDNVLAPRAEPAARSRTLLPRASRARPTTLRSASSSSQCRPTPAGPTSTFASSRSGTFRNSSIIAIGITTPAPLIKVT